jgi:hypothetical protein
MKRESHLASIPFSITPDAEDYLRNRLSEMPDEAHPVLMMTECQSDGLNPPRWRYEGKSFILGYFAADQNSDVTYSECELLGRPVAIESKALTHLSGQTLSLRRVGASRGLMKVSRYVLVSDLAPSSTDSPQQTRRIFSIAALTILGGFTGMGVIWIVSATVASILKISFERLFSVILPLFVIGWTAGAIISFYFFKSVFKTTGRTKFAQEQTQRKYLGYGGLDAVMNWWTFLGIPVPLTGILIFAIEPFARSVGEKSGIAVGAVVVMFAASIYICDKLPQRLVFRLGILGWVLTFAFGFWYFKTHGP